MEQIPEMHYCLIGHPVAHSLSPRIHMSAFRALSIPAVYETVDTSEKGLEATVRDLIRCGYRGWNVTMPDKTAMCSLCDELSEESELAQSVNTVKNENGRLCGTTTDGIGFLHAAEMLGTRISGNKITLLGGGGAASAILISSALTGASEISVFLRHGSSWNRILEISEKLSGKCSTRISLHDFSDPAELKREIGESVLLANATGVGMGSHADESLIPDESYLPSSTAVFDAIYFPEKTRLLRTAEKAGCPAANGLPMLLGQAAASFRIWTGRDMPVTSLNLSLRDLL
jgi:shikimate dehydrogenase